MPKITYMYWQKRFDRANPDKKIFELESTLGINKLIWRRMSIIILIDKYFKIVYNYLKIWKRRYSEMKTYETPKLEVVEIPAALQVEFRL